MMAAGRDASAFANPNDEEKRYLGDLAHWNREESGYQWIQGTRPQTLAFALTDSPIGLAAWIVEKFRAWSDCDGDVESAIGRDRMLADIALYWFTGAIGSSFWPYYARFHGAAILPAGETISVPTGYAQFPREILKPPRSAAARVFTDIRRWSVMPKGGHFAALEQPALLADEVRAFFRELR
jgi:pimeloyl-ACP methyl ester carboxylesterase